MIIFIEAFIEDFFIGVLSCIAPPGNQNNTIQGTIFGYLILVFILFVQISTLYVALQTKATLKSVKFLQKWGEIYENLKNEDKYQILFRFWFCLRRIFFISSIFLL